MKKIILLTLMAFTLLPVGAQDNKSKKGFNASAGLDLVSRYMWRGTEMANVSLQPQLSASWKGLSIGATSNIGFDKDDLQDLDLTLSYTLWGINIGVKDYWTKDVDVENRYFYYDEHGPHQLEANLGYSCKYFSLQAYTMFLGNDFKINGDRAYSTYVELSVPFRAGGLQWDARVGITPMESAGYSTTRTVQGLLRDVNVVENHYFYGEGFTCNMASLRATKTIELNRVRIPVFAELHTNPYLQKAYFIAGIGIASF